MNTIKEIQDNEVYKQIIADSFGGVMYNVANRGKYNADHILFLWLNMPKTEREVAGGIMKGAFNFLTEGDN
jgi:hypothetical protein